MKKKTPFGILCFLVIVSSIVLIGLSGTFDHTSHTDGEIQVIETAYGTYPEGLKISSFNTTWGGEGMDAGAGIALDDQGDVYITGKTNSYGNGGYDFILIKYYNNGTKAWNKTWGGLGDDYGNDIILDSNNSIYITGIKSRNLSLVKFDSNGSEIWNATWGGSDSDGGSDLAIDSNNNIYCFGDTHSYDLGFGDMVLVKFSPNGTRDWIVFWGGIDTEEAYAMDMDSNENIYCLGYSKSFEAQAGDLVLIKFDPDGNKIWNRTWGGQETERGYDISIDEDDNIYCTGYTNSFGDGDIDLILIKFHPNGSLIWNRTWDREYDDIGYGITVDSKGYIYCTGVSHGDEFLLIKFNQEGQELWHEIWGGTGDIYGGSIIRDPNDNIFCSGCNWTINKDLLLYKVYNLAPLINSTTATPSDGSVGVSKKPILSVNVSDLDGEAMNVSFYNADDDGLIGTDIHVPSGEAASVQWSNLTGGTSYRWYAVATDGTDSMTSEMWEFTTENQAPNLPLVISPANQSSGLGPTVTFQVEFSDPDGNNLSANFYLYPYWLFIIVPNIESGGILLSNWTIGITLDYGTTYYWYVNISDGMDTIKSPMYEFTTMPDPNQNNDDIPGFEILPCIMGMIVITASIISLRKRRKSFGI